MPVPAYPPPVPPDTRIDATPQAVNHPGDHNMLADALSSIINELGNNPSGNVAADLTTRMAQRNPTINSGALGGGDVVGSSTVGTINLGTTAYARLLIINAFLAGFPISAPGDYMLTWALNGTGIVGVSSGFVPVSADTLSLQLSHLYTLPGTVAGNVTIVCTRTSGTGAFRIAVDSRFSRFDILSFPLN